MKPLLVGVAAILIGMVGVALIKTAFDNWSRPLLPPRASKEEKVAVRINSHLFLCQPRRVQKILVILTTDRLAV